MSSLHFFHRYFGIFTLFAVSRRAASYTYPPLRLPLWYYGLAYRLDYSTSTVWYPYPINYFIRWGRKIFMRHRV